MIVNTLFNIGDVVWDSLTQKKTTVTGISVKVGEQCCSTGFLNEIRYTVKDHLCHSYRKENELVEWVDQSE